MKTRIVCAILVPLCTLSFTGAADKAADHREAKLSARLNGFNEVTPKLTSSTGKFSAVVDRNRASVTFTLSFSDLSDTVLFSHIHFGQSGVNGGVMVFLCNSSSSGPQPRPCPSLGGTVRGTFTAEDVVGPGPGAGTPPGSADQGIDPQSLNDVLAAIASGETYVNVHSKRWPGGEIRGQVETDEHGKDEHGKDKHEKDEH